MGDMDDPEPEIKIITQEQLADIEELKRGGNPGQRIIQDTQADVAEWGDKKGSAPSEATKSEERGNDKSERKDAPAPLPALAPIAAVTTVVVTEPAATPAPEAKERDRDRGSDKGNGDHGSGKRKDK